MERKYEELLKMFQCDYIRNIEETFAQSLSENELVRLFFINENQAFTDGRNIVVDPASDELFADRAALDKTGDFLSWPKVVLADPWNVLSIITRAQTIHECLHLLYTDFPGRHLSDQKCNTRNRMQVMGMISNIIEDAYIESVGCSYFDNMEFYLKFGRVSQLFASHPAEGTVNRTFGKMVNDEKAAGRSFSTSDTEKLSLKNERLKSEMLVDYLDYMVTFLLYPMVQLPEPPADISEYIEKSKQLFLDGSMASSPEARYSYVSKAFDLIAQLIPEDNEEIDFHQVLQLLGGAKTHGIDGSTIGDIEHRGKEQSVTIRLFTDAEGNERENIPQVDELMRALQSFAKDKNNVIEIIEYKGHFAKYSGSDFDCAVIHKNIKINENHPQINYNLRKAYQNIYDRYRINIHSYNSRFKQILKARAIDHEEKRLYGSGISSARLSDPQKRYWYRNTMGEDAPDMAIMLLIDGSGSMRGERKNAAMQSSVILHEVLKKQGITHAIVEHRAEFEDPEIDVNILVSFNGREDEKLNLMQINAFGDNRDGLALFWAERYILSNTQNENRIIIVLSDGVPEHTVDHYYPPVSTKDTANAVKKINKRGTDIVAISLDSPNEWNCYEQLSQIYPNIVACNDLGRLTSQLLGIIAKLI